MNTDMMNDFDGMMRRAKSQEVLHAVWLYDEDEAARKLVDESAEYGVYAHEALRKQDATLHSYGEDYARAVAPELADEPMGLVEQVLDRMPEERRGVYRGEFDRLRLSGNDRRQDYYGLYGRIVRDETRRQYAEQKRVLQQEQERVQGLVSATLAGKAGVLSPEDFSLLTKAGINYDDVQLAGYVATLARHGATAEQQADVLYERKASPAARQMALQQITADALEQERKTGERGFFENMVKSFSSTGEAVEDVMGSMLPSEQNMLSPGVMRGADGEWLDGAQLSERVTNRAAWRGRVREAVESGRGQAREAIGFRVSSMPSGLATGLVRLAPWLVPGIGQGPAMGGLVTDSFSRGYGVQQSAADAGDGSVSDVQVQGKVLAQTVAGSIPMGGGSWLVRNGVGRLLPQSMTLGARALSKAPVAYAANAAATTATFGAVLPTVEYGLNAVYDVMPGTHDKLDTGARDLEMLGEQLGTGSYWAEQGLLGAVLGAPAAGATRRRATMYLGELRGAMSEGITRRQFESTIHMKPEEQMRELEKMRRQNLEVDAEATIKRAVEQSREFYDREKALQWRTDEAIRAAMEEFGFSVEAAGEEGMVNLYYGGEVQPDGTFKRGEKCVTLPREDADVYLQASIGYKLEGMADLLKNTLGNRRLLDAFREDLKGEVRVEWMRDPDNLANAERIKKRALERIETRTGELMTENGLNDADARRLAGNEVHQDISERGTLGELVQFATNMRERYEQEVASSGQDISPEEFGSRANVTREVSGDGQRMRRVLRLATDARAHEIAEELGEQTMYDWRESQGMTVTEAYRYLRAFVDWAKQSEYGGVAKAAGKLLSLHKTHPELAERVMQADFHELDLSVDEYRALERELTEAGSRLMLSELRKAAADHAESMPAWARDLFMVADLNLLELERDMNLAMAMEQARQEGVLDEAAQKLFGVGREAVEAALAAEPEAQEYHLARYEAEKRQSELDAAYGAGKLTEPSLTEEFEARARDGQAAIEREREEEEARAAAAASERLEEFKAEPENAGKSHEQVVQEAAERAADAAEERLQGEPTAEQDAGFSGGRCIEISDESGLVCKSGLLEVGKLKVLPNFKLGADEDSGVVHPLKGDYRPDHDPIRVWRKADGELLVISGRHRLDAAKRAGATRISAYVYEESEVRDLAWARRYDIESNIRDNQATPLEVALYVRGEFTDGTPLSNEQVERAGITREGKLGSIGFRIGRRAGDSVMDALRNGAIDDRVALWIADFCPGNDAVQRRGLEVALRDGSKAEILARMEAELAKQQMQEEMGLDGGMDLFGNTLDNDEFMDFVAQYVLRRRNELAQDASYLNATAKKRNAEAMGKKYGVDVKDPVALKKKLAEINALRERWKNPYSDSELMDEIRAAWRGREGSDIPADAVASMAETPSERLFREYASMEWQTVHFSVIGPNAATWDKYRDRMFTGRDDGMPRAEIDASGAKLIPTLKPGSLYKNEVWKAKELLSGDAYQSEEYVRMSGARRLALVTASSMTFGKRLGDSQTWKDLKSFICDGKEPGEFLRELGLSEDSVSRDIHKARERAMDEYREARWQLAEIAEVSRKSFMLAFDALYGEGGNINDYARTAGDWDGLGNNLGDILDYPELYEAYPELRDIPIEYKPGNSSFSRMTRGEGLSGAKIILGTDKTPEKMRGTLLHEIQHLIQLHEDFAFGGSASNVRGVFDKLGRLNELGAPEDAPDDYKRLSGEIEARAVSRRQFMSAEERATMPFNDSMEYEGNALTYRPSEYYAALEGAGGVTHYSICGMRAKTAHEYVDKKADYVDPADGQRKFVVPVTGARLRSDVTPGMMNVAPGGHKDVSLAALLHYPELFRAYPELAEMRVRLYYPKPGSEKIEYMTGGYFSPQVTSAQASFIAVNMYHRESVLTTLLHESQHAIQHLEGFAMGAGAFDQNEALAYLDAAIAQRQEAGLHDDWSRDNMEHLERMRSWVLTGDENACKMVYVMSHGEQEARYTEYGHGKAGDNPMSADAKDRLVKSAPSSYTVAVRSNATELGGVTFLNMGRFGYLLDSRLAPAGEFHFDRRVYQMRENIVRRMRELQSQDDGSEEADGLRLAAEGLAVIDSIEALLPNTYRAALEPYKVYFNTYAKLRGSGNPGAAARTVPMEGWDDKMFRAFQGIAWRLISGKTEARGEFWEHAFQELPEAEEGLESMREFWEETHAEVEAEYAERLADAPNAKARRIIKAMIENETFSRVELVFSKELYQLYQAIGSMRADRLMAKFLERVALQLDAFRKDTTLGRIRRVVNALTPLPGKDGKPVKGRMSAEAYNKVMDLMRLLELTKGEKLAFERTRYTGEEDSPDGKQVWAELEPETPITVETYNADGEPVVVSCTKQEYETYACFDGMTASQAEGAAKALGEFITTGRQAWENAEELRKQRIARMCTPLMEAHAETLNDERQRKQLEKRGVLPMTSFARKVHAVFGSWMNDAQFFDSMTGVKEVEVFARDFTDRMARAKVYIESKEKERRATMMDAVFEASGAKTGEEAREFID